MNASTAHPTPSPPQCIEIRKNFGIGPLSMEARSQPRSIQDPDGSFCRTIELRSRRGVQLARHFIILPNMRNFTETSVRSSVECLHGSFCCRISQKHLQGSTGLVLSHQQMDPRERASHRNPYLAKFLSWPWSKRNAPGRYKPHEHLPRSYPLLRQLPRSLSHTQQHEKLRGQHSPYDVIYVCCSYCQYY